MILLLCNGVKADDWGWTGLVDNKWSTPGNWTVGSGYPSTASDLVYILSTNNTPINLDTPVTVQSLIFSNTPQDGISIINNVLSIAAGGRIAHNCIGAGLNNQTWYLASEVNLLGDVYIQNPNSDIYARRLEVSGNITGNGTMYMSGATGKEPGYWGLNISGNNTNFTGAAVITNGAVQMSHANAFGTNPAPVELRKGVLSLNTASVSKPVKVTGTSTLNASGNSTYSGSIELSGSPTLTLDSYNSGNYRQLMLNGPITGTGDINVSSHTYVSGQYTAFGGTAANTFTGKVTITRESLILTKTAGVNAIPGNVIIGDGDEANHILLLGSANQISDTGRVIFGGTSATADYSCLRLNGFSETVGGLQSLSNGFGTVENGHAVTSATITNNNSTDCTFSGVIRNGSNAVLNVAKSGIGTWYFNGTATDAGLWTVIGGTLGGTGTISGAVTVESSAAVNPGTNTGSAGILVINNNLTFNSGSVLNFDLGQPDIIGSGTNDLITGVSNLDLNGTLNVTASSGFAIGTYRLINYTGTLSGGGLAIGSKPENLQVVVNTSTVGQVDLIVKSPGTVIIVR